MLSKCCGNECTTNFCPECGKQQGINLELIAELVTWIDQHVISAMRSAENAQKSRGYGVWENLYKKGPVTKYKNWKKRQRAISMLLEAADIHIERSAYEDQP